MAAGGARSLATSIGAAVVLLVVATSVLIGGAGVLVSDRLVTDAAGERVRSIAASVAVNPDTVAAVGAGESTAAVRDLAARVRVASEVSFITIAELDGTRLTHPNPDRIGETYLGTLAPVAGGETVIERFTGTLGTSIRAAVPVRDADGQPIGAVAVGVPVETVTSLVREARGPFLAAAATAVALALAGAVAVQRALRRRTFGLSRDELARQHAHTKRSSTRSARGWWWSTRTVSCWCATPRPDGCCVSKGRWSVAP